MNVITKPIQKEVVLIDPKTQSITKTYINKEDALKDLNLYQYKYFSDCLTNRTHTFHGFILKYLVEATPENIIFWSNKHKYALDGTIKCPGCNLWVNLNDKVDKTYCRLCIKQTNHNNSVSENGFFVKIANGLVNKAIKRKNKGRMDAGICSIDAIFLKKLFEFQKGLCYYSGIKMNPTILTDFQMSVERINNSMGYIDSNVQLICLEFNTGHTQWNLKKINMILTLRQKKINIIKLESDVLQARKVKKDTNKKISPKRKNKIVDNIIYYLCTLCKEYQTAINFSLARNKPDSKCKKCMKIKHDIYLATLRGFLITLLDSAKKHAKQCKKNLKRKDSSGTFNLTLDILLDKILIQKGRCYYSQIPLVFTPKADFRASIERIDNSKGYIIDNTVLICLEFNSSDHTTFSKNIATGSSQWNPEKIALLIKTLEAKNKPKDDMIIKTVENKLEVTPIKLLEESNDPDDKKLIKTLKNKNKPKINIFTKIKK